MSAHGGNARAVNRRYKTFDTAKTDALHTSMKPTMAKIKLNLPPNAENFMTLYVVYQLNQVARFIKVIYRTLYKCIQNDYNGRSRNHRAEINATSRETDVLVSSTSRDPSVIKAIVVDKIRSVAGKPQSTGYSFSRQPPVNTGICATEVQDPKHLAILIAEVQ